MKYVFLAAMMAASVANAGDIRETAMEQMSAAMVVLVNEAENRVSHNHEIKQMDLWVESPDVVSRLFYMRLKDLDLHNAQGIKGVGDGFIDGVLMDPDLGRHLYGAGVDLESCSLVVENYIDCTSKAYGDIRDIVIEMLNGLSEGA